ncbi:hypothetical protein [Cryobacterium sp. PH29-G1]|uniref:DUF6993 domain-containing protein n=1 Tax=Cryobacterium sp. PH29-G1 TaxID=3046211 RepID=UPI0024B9301B|nr:hypothetical protein [Cryobacterium sp. PH29-G1]MDJ0349265.1 hypothetical protein [Cryobacterium sp. PH29-G1]
MSVAAPAQQDGTASLQRRRVRRLRLTVGAVLLLGAGLTACSGGTVEPSSSAPEPSTSVTPEPSATPAPDPTLVPAGTAGENLAYFNFLAAAVTKSDPSAGGSAYIDALVAGGFDRTAMEVTFDRTQADLAADAVQFSVRFADECLIGQIGPASDGFHSVVAPLLSTGLCLLGSTRPIDW